LPGFLAPLETLSYGTKMLKIFVSLYEFTSSKSKFSPPKTVEPSLVVFQQQPHHFYIHLTAHQTMDLLMILRQQQINVLNNLQQYGHFAATKRRITHEIRNINVGRTYDTRSQHGVTQKLGTKRSLTFLPKKNKQTITITTTFFSNEQVNMHLIRRLANHS
jgi:hypothetical protein